MYTMQINAEMPGRKFEVWNVSTGRLVVAFRQRKDAEREVDYLTAQERERALRVRLNPFQESDSPDNLAILAAHAAGTNPEPEPPAPAVPAVSLPVARPVPAGIACPARFQTVEAAYLSTCGISGRRIYPGDLICRYGGAWCLAEQAVAHDEHRRAEGVQRRADRDYADCLIAFMDRMPVAA